MITINISYLRKILQTGMICEHRNGDFTIYIADLGIFYNPIDKFSWVVDNNFDLDLKGASFYEDYEIQEYYPRWDVINIWEMGSKFMDFEYKGQLVWTREEA